MMLPATYFSSKNLAIIFVTVNGLEVILRQIIIKLEEYLKHHGEDSLKKIDSYLSLLYMILNNSSSSPEFSH